ncbi:MAG TPA: ATP-binding protein [Candidatus Dormibacteraeota bacterium]|nr:ATP-binding protein [Candidatus Dormibacteraeota bacterium]
MVELEMVELFCGLNRKELLDLREISREKRFSGGSQIFREGDRGDGLYIIKDGSVQIAHMVGEEVRHIFSQLGPGEIFGEMAVIEDRPRSATAVALTDTQLYFIAREEMRTLLQHSPGLAFNFLQEISRRLREFNQRHLHELVQAESLAVFGRFAQGIVHDLKNPLSIIGLSAEIFDMQGVNPEIRATARSRIKKQVGRISDMIGDILIFTEGKKTESEIKPADYRAYVLELLPDLNTEAGLKTVSVELQGDLPEVRIQLDPRRLSRVFYNLVHNATDVMPNGGKIFLRFQLDKNEIITEIEDTGPGIAPEIAGKLFQPFATHGKAHGTGLGLSICKKIVEDHKGRIWTRSEPKRGAIFCFALPLAK